MKKLNGKLINLSLMIFLSFMLNACSTNDKLPDSYIGKDNLSWWGKKSKDSSFVWVYGSGVSWGKALIDAQRALPMAYGQQIKEMNIETTSFSNNNIGKVRSIVTSKTNIKIPMKIYMKCKETAFHTNSNGHTFIRLQCPVQTISI